MILCKLIEKLLLERHCPRVLRAVYSPPVSLKQLTLEGCILLWFSEASEKGLLISSQRFQGLSTAKKVLCENNFSETSFRRKRTSKIFPIVPVFLPKRLRNTIRGFSTVLRFFRNFFVIFFLVKTIFRFFWWKKIFQSFLVAEELRFLDGCQPTFNLIPNQRIMRLMFRKL